MGTLNKISYQNCPVTINGIKLFATNATWAQGQNIERLSCLGGLVGTAVGEPPQATLNAEFYIGSTGIAYRFGSRLSKTGNKFFECKLGGLTFSNCLLESFNVAAESNSLINGSLGVTCYGNIEGVVAGTATTGRMTGAHAAKSRVDMVTHGDVSGIGFSANPYSFSYDLSKEYSINRVVGTGALTQTNVKFASATESVTLQGDNLPRGIVKNITGEGGFACPTGYNISLRLKSTCPGASYGTVGLTSGIVVSRDIAVVANDIARGSVTLERYY